MPVSVLRCCVVVPARDEQELVGACLDALAAQGGVAPDEWEVVVVLDACADDTAGEVARARDRHPSLRVGVLAGPGRGAGPARRVGMDAAAARLPPGGLIACTDADSTVAPDWVAAQLAAVAAGARAIGGRIEIAPAEMATLPAAVAEDRRRRQRRRHQLILANPGPPGSTSEHWQFSGASLAVTADVYRHVGGMGPQPALEDEAFERALIDHGVPIHRPLAVRVTTSGRLVGRAEDGLAHDLAEAAFARCVTGKTQPEPARRREFLLKRGGRPGGAAAD